MLTIADDETTVLISASENMPTQQSKNYSAFILICLAGLALSGGILMAVLTIASVYVINKSNDTMDDTLDIRPIIIAAIQALYQLALLFRENEYTRAPLGTSTLLRMFIRPSLLYLKTNQPDAIDTSDESNEVIPFESMSTKDKALLVAGLITGALHYYAANFSFIIGAKKLFPAGWHLLEELEGWSPRAIANTIVSQLGHAYTYVGELAELSRILTADGARPRVSTVAGAYYFGLENPQRVINYLLSTLTPSQVMAIFAPVNKEEYRITNGMLGAVSATVGLPGQLAARSIPPMTVPMNLSGLHPNQPAFYVTLYGAEGLLLLSCLRYIGSSILTAQMATRGVVGEFTQGLGNPGAYVARGVLNLIDCSSSLFSHSTPTSQPLLPLAERRQTYDTFSTSDESSDLTTANDLVEPSHLTYEHI